MDAKEILRDVVHLLQSINTVGLSRSNGELHVLEADIVGSGDEFDTAIELIQQQINYLSQEPERGNDNG